MPVYPSSFVAVHSTLSDRVTYSFDDAATYSTNTSRHPACYSRATAPSALYLVDANTLLVYQSTDWGPSWQSVGTSPGSIGARPALYVSPDERIFLVSPAGTNGNDGCRVYRSGDMGATWTTHTVSSTPTGGATVPRAYSIEEMADGSLTVQTNFSYAASEARIWRSTDQGATWNETFRLSEAGHVMGGMYVTKAGTALLLAGRYTGALAFRVYRSVNHGVTWSQVLSADTDYGSVGSGAQPRTCFTQDDNGRIYLSRIFGASSIYASTNDGVTWSEYTAPGFTTFTQAKARGMGRSKGALFLSTGADGNHLRSINNGASWAGAGGTGVIQGEPIAWWSVEVENVTYDPDTCP